MIGVKTEKGCAYCPIHIRCWGQHSLIQSRDKKTPDYMGNPRIYLGNKGTVHIAYCPGCQCIVIRFLHQTILCGRLRDLPYTALLDKLWQTGKVAQRRRGLSRLESCQGRPEQFTDCFERFGPSLTQLF